MLAREIHDDVESGAGRVDGLGLLPVRVRFAAGKTLGRPAGHAYGHPVSAYEIHHGVATVEGGEPFLDGCRAGDVWGTTWHGEYVLRVSISNWSTTDDDVDRSADAIARAAEFDRRSETKP